MQDYITHRPLPERYLGDGGGEPLFGKTRPFSGRIREFRPECKNIEFEDIPPTRSAVPVCLNGFSNKKLISEMFYNLHYLCQKKPNLVISKGDIVLYKSWWDIRYANSFPDKICYIIYNSNI